MSVKSDRRIHWEGIMKIGAVARAAGVSVRSLRYYEEQGLITSDRTSGGQRVYSGDVVERVVLIQRLFAAGLSSRTIAHLMPYISAGRLSATGTELMRSERDRIALTILDLQSTLSALDRMIHISEHPDAQHCPALREPAWSPYISTAADVDEHSRVADV